MTQKDIAIVFDCGATNVRVVAITKTGEILASNSVVNETDADPNHKGGLIWEMDKMWGKLCNASKEVVSKIDVNRIAGATVTTFGVDGALVDDSGNMLYPVISWQCNRTQTIMDNISKYVSVEELYATSGIFPYAFNTINKLIWLKENRPELLKKADKFIFITSLVIHRLTGELKNDVTMAGTSMLLDQKTRTMSKNLLAKLGINPELFGELAEPGEQAGFVTPDASTSTNLPKGTPVFFAGHDTQFAVFGSGAQLNQPVLSSGTWEILMARSKAFSASSSELKNNLTTESDAIPGQYNIGQNWLGSGVLEWFSRNFYPEVKGDALFETMINEASELTPDSHGLTIDPAFYNNGTSNNGGTITGLTINTTRSQIYRALLESLAYRLRESLEALQEAGKFKAERIICVGGGSKNRLWNQLRADVCNLPIQLIDQKETTVLGASMFVFAGAGVCDSPHAAIKNIAYNPTVINPSSERAVYDEFYQKYLNYKSR